MQMAWSIIVSVTLLIAYNLNLAAATKKTKVDEICPYSPLQGSFNQIYSNRPSVGLGNDSESAALVYGSWDSKSIQQFQDCAFHVDSNLYFDASNPENSQVIRRGLTFSVRKINFRYNATTNQCTDYIRFTFPGSKTDKICGTFDGESAIGQGTYFFDPTGVIKVHIFVDKSRNLTDTESSVEIELVFTAYQHCKGGNLIQCHSTDDNFCISNTLKSDGIHNCIPPSNADEPDKPFPIYGENAERKMEEWQNETEWQRKKTGGATQIYSMSCLFYLITVASLAFSTM